MDGNSLMKLLGAWTHHSWGRGAEESQIAKAEQQLGCTLPADYVSFLRNLGWCDAGPFEVYGLGSDVPWHLELIRNTCWERHKARPRLWRHLIPVYPDGGGNHMCLDTSRIEGDHCSVVYWIHDCLPEEQAEVWFPSFDAWLRDQFGTPDSA
ncbi:MAG TPA: SMI1/KNR4 family protein [Armatimonadota bacterium]|jgi:cell wall assembly regulator SMI1